MKRLLILSFLILTSCGARKVNVNKEDRIVKIDSTSVSKKEIVSNKENYISIITDTDELEIVPIDTTKYIKVDGKTYKNVKLRYKKTKQVLVDTTKIKVSEKSSNKVILNKDISEKSFKKNIDKKESYSFYWWGLLFILLLILFFYCRNKLLKILP